MKTSVPNLISRLSMTVCLAFFVLVGFAQPAPELVFRNPVLKSGNANKEGAVYRFAEVTPGVDAEIKLKRFSRNDIVMRTIDKADMGWDKAFQPEFGLPGLVAANQSWYIDFEMEFFKGGTKQKQKMKNVDLTALDIDGDGVSIAEYAIFDKPKKVTYSTVSYLIGSPAGSVGERIACGECSIESPLVRCSNCNGSGRNGSNTCGNCQGSGMLHDQCDHAFTGVSGTSMQGPVENFTNIDTLSTQVMATYQYEDVSMIKFRYGGRTNHRSSNGAGIRLNSVWFRQFSLAPLGTLPVRLQYFKANAVKKDVMVSWKGSEEAFSHYVVQQSQDGKSYTDVTVVNPGTAAGSYEFLHKDAVTGSAVLYYRLKMVDRNGDVAYSSVQSVKTIQQQLLQLSVYPNPASSQLQVAMPAEWANSGVIEVFSLNGALVKTVASGNARQVTTISLTDLQKGSYVVRVRSQNESAQKTFIKN